MARALRDLGFAVERRGASIVVEGRGGLVPAPSARLDLGDAGTPLRLMAALCCLGHGRFVVDGSARMRERPVRHLTEALARLGVTIRCLNDDGCPPVEIEADGFPGGRVRLEGGVSSQYLSALLMVAPCGAADLDIEVAGTLVSRPYVDLTVEVMRAFGVEVDRDGYRSFHVTAGAPYRPCDYPVEGDASSASYFFAAAAVAGGSVRVTGIPGDSKQGDLRFLDMLARMGCQVTRRTDRIEVSRVLDGGARLAGIDADLGDCPDVAPTLAVVALFARGETTLRNIGHLRVKETDRIEGIAACVRSLGAAAQTGPDWMVVHPPAAGTAGLHGADIDPMNDHRLAMAFSIAGLALPGVTILDPGCVSKSFPGFYEHIGSI
jgi:3-phosphoshikimate 1-carboxyvinyltransferase